MAFAKRAEREWLPLHDGDVEAWEATARADFVSKVFGIVAAQALAACAAATAPLVSVRVRDFVLSHPGMAHAAMVAPLLLIL